jgi:hypothetical protein
MSQLRNRWILALVLSALPLAGSSPALAAGGGKSLGKASGVVPAIVEDIPGSELRSVTLTERAIRRIDLQTTSVWEEVVEGSARKRTVVPYSSILYDPQGRTWVYTSSKPRTFVREQIDVDFIEGDRVVLKDGPPPGTTIASVGAAELYGAEFKIGH